MLEDPIQRAEVEMRVAQLVEPVAERVDVGLQPVDLFAVVLVGLFLLGDQLATATGLFRNGSLDGLPLLGKVPQLAIERGQLAGQFLAELLSPVVVIIPMRMASYRPFLAAIVTRRAQIAIERWPEAGAPAQMGG